MPIVGGTNVSRGPFRDVLPEPEIFWYPLSFTEIESEVLDAAGVTAAGSGSYIGRRFLLAGTILHKRGDGQVERFTAAGGQSIYAILFRTVEVLDTSANSDTPVPVVPKFVGAKFKSANIVDYATHSAALATAFPNAVFA